MLYYLIESSEIPEFLKEETVYLIKEGQQRLHAALLCPCGCRSQINLNLLPDSYPYWKIRKIKKQTLTIYPSIWKLSGCKSHFFIRKGKVVWARNWD